MYSSSLHKRKLYPSTQLLSRPKFSTNMRFKSSSRNYGLLNHLPSSPDGKMKKSKSRKYTSIPSVKIDTRRKLDNFTDAAYNEAVSRLRVLLNESYNPKITHIFEDSGDETDDKSVFSNFTRISKHYHTPVPYKRELIMPKQNTKEPPSSELMSFIERQEDYINQLEKESQYCRNELAGLLDKVKEVISENEQLHKKHKLGLIKSVTDTLDTETDEDPSETHININKFANTKRPLEGPAIVFESRISELEAQLTQCKIDLKKTQEDNNTLQRQLSDNVFSDSPAVKKQLEILQREKENLQETITKLQMNAALDNDNNTLDKKHVEQARWERERTEAKLRRLQSELQRVNDNSAEQARRYSTERDALERRYSQQIDQLNTELTVQWDTASKLQLELDKHRREITDLRRELSQKNAYIDDVKKELQSKTVTLQSEQSQSTAEKCSLEQELANAKLSADCTERAHKQECTRLQSEITSLRQRLDRADADTLHMRRENMRLSEKLSSLEKELNLNKLLSENRNTSYGDQSPKEALPIMPLPPPDSSRDKELTSMVKNIEAKHEATVAELEGMIQSQNALMEKLTGECHSLTKKLEESSVKHKNEIAKLQTSLKNLSSKLDNTQTNSTDNFRMKEKHNTPTDPENYSSENVTTENNISAHYDKQNDDYDDSKNLNYAPIENNENNISQNYENDRNINSKYENDTITNGNYNDNKNYVNTEEQNIDELTREKQDYENTYEETYTGNDNYEDDTNEYNTNVENSNYTEDYNVIPNNTTYTTDTPELNPNTSNNNTEPNENTKYEEDSNIYQENDQLNENQLTSEMYNTSDITQEQYNDPNIQYTDDQNYIPEQQYSENIEPEYQMDESYPEQQYDDPSQDQNYTEQEYTEQPQSFIEEESKPPQTQSFMEEESIPPPQTN